VSTVQDMPTEAAGGPATPRPTASPALCAGEAGERAKLTRARADVWFQREIDAAARALGVLWPLHGAWVRAYLVEEARQRLLAAGWSPGA